ncbi:PucR family transcriptional regulator [Microbacterium sp. cf332]|uniref:helix-turn-helix domain-containing protein n=1 Tax=Microbacterium sp. cf332 TaxID=1761804 RepID=UPI000886B157|nr:PucR family transcriptional regulator [Microbacterium sp. cf332]SDQ58053.1 DNA-binding transcriptional regulator, PucR family [Microbacterium sp. cf332]
MKVSELLAAPGLSLTIAFSGDVDVEIEWVHAVDRFPASEFMSGGEVALTSGQWWPAVAAEVYVQDLVEAGVIALGFGLTKTITDLPSQLLAACEAQGLTFFLVPIEVPFIRVIKTFVQAERRTWERPLRRHLDYYRTFVAALREDRSLASMLSSLSSGLGTTVGLVADREVSGVASVEGMHPIPLASEGVIDAELFSEADPANFSVEQQAVLSVGVPFIALEVERIRSVKRTVDGYTRELFTWLRSDDHDVVTVLARLRSLGIEGASDLAVLSVWHADPDAVLVAVRREAGSSAAAAARFDDAVLVCVAGADVADRIVAGLPRGASTGRGSSGAADRLRLSLIQAEHALSLARRAGPGMVIGADELNSPSTIMYSEASDLIRETGAALLRPLREYDEARGGQLLHTLEVFLRTGGRLSVAANELYVHPNTLRHRVQLIEDITGRNLDSTRDRTDFDLAIALADRGGLEG